MKPFFSIIIPLYNKEKYIIRTLKSVLNQTYKNYEIIIVDDCSTDNSYLTAKNYLLDKNIFYKIIKRSKQGGSCAPARATGCRYAKGKLFAFIDADDEWQSKFLETIKKLYNKYPEAEAFCTDRNLFINDTIISSSYGTNNIIKKDHIIDLKIFLNIRLSNIGNPFRVPAMAFKPESLDDIGGFIHAPRSSDVDLIFRFFLAGKKAAWSSYIGLNIYRVPDSTMFYTKYKFTRPWYHSVAFKLNQRYLDSKTISDLKQLITNVKKEDIKKALKNNKLNKYYLNNIYFFKNPLFYSIVFVSILFPKPFQSLMHNIFFNTKLTILSLLKKFLSIMK